MECFSGLARLGVDGNDLALLLLVVIIHRFLGRSLLPERGRIVGLVIDTQTLLERLRLLNL